MFQLGGSLQAIWTNKLIENLLICLRRISELIAKISKSNENDENYPLSGWSSEVP